MIRSSVRAWLLRGLTCFVVGITVQAGTGIGSAEEMPIPHLTRYATDLSGTLTTGQLATLESKLSAFDRSTSTQVVVLIVKTLGEGSIEDVSLKVAEANGIGRKGKDNGVLLFVAMGERRVRIETGYGLEGALPDALTGLIIRRELAPRFQSGNYYAGIDAAVDAIMLASKNEYTAPPENRRSTRGLGSSPLIILFFVFIAFIRLARFWSPLRRRRGFGWWGGFPPSSGGWGSGGGSFGGGSFGGGGGSFGGGGASGSW